MPTDARLTPANDRVALDSLRGQVTAPRYVAGEPARIAWPLVDLLAAPGGARNRQLVFGAPVTVIERLAGEAFVQATRDGYCGYLPEAALGQDETPTHWVASPGTHLCHAPRVQAPEIAPLYMGALLRVLAVTGAWAETAQGFVPASHLRRCGDHSADPAAIAQGFLGTPYLWGGNSRAGIDCSGLVQLAFLACGIPMPGDSDLQRQTGTGIADGQALQRNDLLFWRGHVALMLDPGRLIHATAATMSVVEETAADVIARIEAAGAGGVLARRRPAAAPARG